MNNDLYFSNSLIVSPPSRMVTLEAGQSYHYDLTVTNPANSTQDMDFEIAVVPYGVTDDYSADFTTESVYNDIINWVTVEQDSGTLAPNQTATIGYTIDVPADAPAGGQYCAVAVRNIHEDTSTMINEILEIASVVYAEVSGEVIREGEIMGGGVSSIVFTPPITSNLTFSNTGNVHLNAYVTTEIKNIFTGEVVYKPESALTETVMPDTTRFVNYTYEDVPELGIFQFSQNVAYNGTSHQINQTIFVCPIWFMTLVIATIVVIVWAIIFKIRKSKKSSKKIKPPKSPR